jgi:hypothetical protein
VDAVDVRDKWEAGPPRGLVSGPLRLTDAWRLADELNREAAAGLLPGGRWAMYRRLRLLRALGPSAAVRTAGGVLLAVGGIAETLPGVGEAWAVIGRAVTREDLGFRFVRHARRLFDGWTAGGRFHRVGAFVPATDARFVAWVHALGLRYETSLEAATATADRVLVFAVFPHGRAHGT